MIKLLEIKHNGVVVAEAPMLIHDVEGTRAALLTIMEEGCNGFDSIFLSAPLIACANAEREYIGVLFSAETPLPAPEGDEVQS